MVDINYFNESFLLSIIASLGKMLRFKMLDKARSENLTMVFLSYT